MFNTQKPLKPINKIPPKKNSNTQTNNIFVTETMENQVTAAFSTNGRGLYRSSGRRVGGGKETR